MNIPTDAQLGSYLTRMEWTPDNSHVIIQQLNRRQNESYYVMRYFFRRNRNNLSEKDTAWIDILSEWDEDYKMGGWDLLEFGKNFYGPAIKTAGDICIK